MRVITLRLKRPKDIARVREVGQAVARGLGFDAFGATRITTVMVELARNAVRHGGGGKIALDLASRNGHTGLDVVVSDEGSGIGTGHAILSELQRDRGRITRSERGGLAGVRTISDVFTLETSPHGTRVTAGFTSGLPAADLSTAASLIGQDLERLRATDMTAALAQQNDDLLRSLNERDLLIKEIHHRTSNNLIQITSLVAMAMKGARHEEAISALVDLECRIQAVLTVHQQLQQSDATDRLLVVPFLKSISDRILTAFRSPTIDVSIAVDGDDLYVDQGLAVDLGLMIGELMTNAFKHAFDGRESGVIRVTVSEIADHGLRVVVRDDGCGLPPGVSTPERSSSLGWRMIRGMVQRHDGRIDVASDGGLHVCVTLPR